MKEQLLDGLQVFQAGLWPLISSVLTMGVVAILTMLYTHYKEAIFQKLEKRLGKEITDKLKLSFTRFMKTIKLKEVLSDGKIDSVEKRNMQIAAKKFVMDELAITLKAFPKWFVNIVKDKLEDRVESALLDLKHNSSVTDMMLGKDIKKKEEIESSIPLKTSTTLLKGEPTE